MSNVPSCCPRPGRGFVVPPHPPAHITRTHHLAHPQRPARAEVFPRAEAARPGRPADGRGGWKTRNRVFQPRFPPPIPTRFPLGGESSNMGLTRVFDAKNGSIPPIPTRWGLKVMCVRARARARTLTVRRWGAEGWSRPTFCGSRCHKAGPGHGCTGHDRCDQSQGGGREGVWSPTRTAGALGCRDSESGICYEWHMGKPGPIPKGPRKQLSIRVPVDQMPVYEREAAKRGLPLGDYIIGQLALCHGMEEPEYLHRKPKSQHAHGSRRRDPHELPLAG